MSSTPNIRDLLGCHPSSQQIAQYLAYLCALAGLPGACPAPEVKAYPDAVYFNYQRLGMSVLFTPTGAYKPKPNSGIDDLQNEALVLESIDLYNIPKASSTTSKTATTDSKSAYVTFPALPLIFPISPGTVGDQPRPDTLVITAASTGKDIVGTLGEPDRKGGGTGPSSGSIGIWCEYVKDGLMVEFGGIEARGPQAWEKGKNAPWKIITVFAPKT
jgi:hypothetical protein